MAAEDHLPPGDECIHGLGPRSACVICNGTIAARADAEQERTFRAKYPGQCADCNLPIYIGQMICWRPGGQPHHDNCTED